MERQRSQAFHVAQRGVIYEATVVQRQLRDVDQKLQVHVADFGSRSGAPRDRAAHATQREDSVGPIQHADQLSHATPRRLARMREGAQRCRISR